MRQTGFQILRGSADRGPSVAIRSGGLACLRAVGGYIDGDMIVEIDKMAVTMQELYLARLAAVGVIYSLAVEQFARHAEVFPEVLDPDRILPHHAHRRMAGADSQEHPPRSDLVDRGYGMRGYRRDSRAGDRHAGADLDPLGARRRQRHRRVAVGPDHLRIRHPGAIVPELFCQPNVFGRLTAMSYYCYSKFHDVPYPGYTRIDSSR